MDKLKNVAKGGWHPSGDKQIHRDTWKSDLKGIASGKKNDPSAQAKDHQSRPLSSLKDPDSFGPPPRHVGAHGTVAEASSSPSPARTGLGNQISRPNPPTTSRNMQGDGGQDAAAAPTLPYRTNTTGLRTDNLPKPPVRRADPASRNDSPGPVPPPVLPPRQTPKPPQPQAARPPGLPPRQNEFPDECTPAPPPPYTETIQGNQTNPAYINQSAVSRLGQAGVSVPGFGIGSTSNANPSAVPRLGQAGVSVPSFGIGSTSGSNSSASAARGPQLGELQERFARMNTGSQSQTASSLANIASTVQKKAPPPPPPKKSNLASANQEAGPSTSNESSDPYPTPPPLPLGSKPRPS